MKKMQSAVGGQVVPLAVHGVAEMAVRGAGALRGRWRPGQRGMVSAEWAVGVRSVLPLMTCFLPAFLLLGVVPTVASAVLHAFG